VPLVVLLGLLLAGCWSSPQWGRSDEANAGGGNEVKLEVIDKAGFAKVLEQHRGKVVLVDYWATWCRPCRELFPHTVELHKQFADRGLAVISVSFDDPDEDQSKVLKFLTEKAATFDNFISPHGVGSKSFEAFEIGDDGIPHFKLFDRQGKLRKTFAGDEPQEIDLAIEELLGET